jgi:hypothetical protein
MHLLKPFALVILAFTYHGTHASVLPLAMECVPNGEQCGFYWGTLQCCDGECDYVGVSRFTSAIHVHGR